jgi:hypothetical protein
MRRMIMRGNGASAGDTGAGGGKRKYNPGAGDATIVAGRGHWWKMP